MIRSSSKGFYWLLVIFVSTSLLCWSQTEEVPAPEKSTPPAEEKIIPQSAEPGGTYLEYQEPQPISAPKALPLLIKTVISLTIIVDLIYLSVYMIKQLQNRRSQISQGGKLIKTIDVLYLSPQRTIYLLGLPNKILVVGATDQNMNLLSEITEPGLVNDIKEKGGAGLTKTLNFKEQLHKFSGQFALKE